MEFLTDLSTNGKEPVKNVCSPSLPAGVTTLAKWSPHDFLLAFSPDKQMIYATKYSERCLIGNAPTLAVMSDAYGESLTKAWLMIQLIKLNKNVLGQDPSKKMTPEQLEVAAETIMANYYMLKCTEIMLFFVRFMGGKHGKFYGTVDIPSLCAGLDDFFNWRSTQLGLIYKKKKSEEQKQKTKQWEQELENDPIHKYLTREEWEDTLEGQELRLSLPEQCVKLIDSILCNKKL